MESGFNRDFRAGRAPKEPEELPFPLSGSPRRNAMEAEFARNLDALEALFPFVERFVSLHLLDEAAAFAVQLAVEELFTNFVRHNTGGSGRIAVRLDIDGGRLSVILADFDVDPADPAAGTSPDILLPLEERTVGGLGIHLVRSMFDSLTYEYRDRTLRVTAVKNLEDTHV
jgi:serine/threonine-protein kinase RsbW